VSTRPSIRDTGSEAGSDAFSGDVIAVFVVYGRSGSFCLIFPHDAVAASTPLPGSLVAAPVKVKLLKRLSGYRSSSPLAGPA
jgi:hypothetical protein